MRFIERFGKYVVTAVLTFTVGLACSSLTGWFSSSQPQTIAPASMVVQTRLPQIVSNVSGHGVTNDGFQTILSGYEYADGNYLHQLCIYYDSPERAHAELEKRLQHASKIIARQPFLNEQGRQIGQQVIATFPFQPDSDSSTAELLRTEHGTLIVLRRRALLDLMHDFYEKR